MMRFYAVIALFLFSCLGVYAESMFDLDVPPEISIDKLQTEYAAKINEQKKDVKGVSSEMVTNPKEFYSKDKGGTKNKKNSAKNKKSKKQKAQFDPVAGGYKGNIPSIKSEFGYKSKKAQSVKNDAKNAEDFTPDEFQKSKTDDPLFLDVILNKQAQSKYIQDMLRVMKFLEGFRDIVASHNDVQKFNANVNVLDLHARRIEKLYADTPDSGNEAYYKLMDLSYKAKVLGNLKFDANHYSKFSPVTGTQYDPSYILDEDNKLLIDLDKTIFAIRQLNN